MALEVRSVRKYFGQFAALHDVSLQVPDGQLVALLGPSGSGKTTLLRVIAGLEPPDAGQVLYDDRDVTRQPARLRGVGMVFQHFALFPHLDVYENIAFSLRIRKAPEPEVRHRVGELLDLIQLTGLERRRPAQLSGGQRQRVALARALAAQPKLLLLDEPFSALDARVRRDLRRWLRELHERIQTTCLFVTHDHEEAFELADRVVLFDRGNIAADGPPDALWNDPKSLFALRFFGQLCEVPGNVVAGQFRAGAGEDALHFAAPQVTDGPAVLAVRQRDLQLVPPAEATATAGKHWHATVERVSPLGWKTAVDLRLPGDLGRLQWEGDAAAVQLSDLRVGALIGLKIGRGQVFSTP
jgi:sulfate transport system ATP-binding protein